MVLLASMIGLAGGFEQAEPEPLPVVAVDEVFEGEPWNVAVSRAVLFSELEPSRLRDPDRNHWLAVVAEIEITAAETRGDIRQVVAVSGIEGLVGEADGEVPGTVPPYDVRIVRDATPVVGLHPGLTERVVYLWERANELHRPASPPQPERRVVARRSRPGYSDSSGI